MERNFLSRARKLKESMRGRHAYLHLDTIDERLRSMAPRTARQPRSEVSDGVLLTPADRES